MLLMALALAAQDLPPFDPAESEQVCKTYYTQSESMTAEGWLAWCVGDERTNRRHLTLIVAAEPVALQPVQGKCLKEWTTGGLVRWSMVDLCVSEALAGRRDYELYLSVATTPTARQAIRACIKSETDEDDGVVDWEAVADCAAGVDPALR